MSPNVRQTIYLLLEQKAERGVKQGFKWGFIVRLNTFKMQKFVSTIVTFDKNCNFKPLQSNPFELPSSISWTTIWIDARSCRPNSLLVAVGLHYLRVCFHDQIHWP